FVALRLLASGTQKSIALHGFCVSPMNTFAGRLLEVKEDVIARARESESSITTKSQIAMKKYWGNLK
ncbi:hypothetical protein PY257_16390, partial [Ramlibacter sp. H39-3-26]|uniref:hypothetical protein n=1 Tax=Curvibacter soli TaxID=3031331 RepID=UPI0023D97CAA